MIVQPVYPCHSALAIRQDNLRYSALEQAPLRGPRRESFYLIQNLQGVGGVTETINFACNRLSGRIGFAGAGELPQAEEFSPHLARRYEFRSQSPQMMVQWEAAAQGAIYKKEIGIALWRFLSHILPFSRTAFLS
jgi:hypothetical protein